MDTLKEYLKKYKQTIVYFYPKDNTPGCTREAKDFSAYKDLFNRNGIGIVGISKDSAASHTDFKEKQDLTIDLVTDEDLSLHKQFGVWGDKNNYGKITQGTIRSTFLVDQKEKIIKERRKVKADGHVQKVIEELKLQ